MIGLLADQGIFDEVRGRAHGIVRDASALLKILPDTEERRLLLELGTYFVARGRLTWTSSAIGSSSTRSRTRSNTAARRRPARSSGP